MSDDGRGDDVYQPDGSDGADRPADGLDPENVIDEPGLDDILDTGYSPPEKPLGVSKHGTTGEEQREGESLDGRLAQEEPEQDPLLPDGADAGPEDNGPEEDDAGDERAGRVAAPEEAGRLRNNRVMGRDVGVDGGAASAEEAAVHIQDDDSGT
ncbi:DUF5709 domain-containing protein [Streptomyces sp. NPDC006288]|uniref:DUF5709 domain-containing protein n=1 Tax=Streptomyces sp. NPDC006288 TaxID=3156743 RepID=UPI0033BEF23E